jgi:hypothetical protein
MCIHSWESSNAPFYIKKVIGAAADLVVRCNRLSISFFAEMMFTSTCSKFTYSLTHLISILTSHKTLLSLINALWLKLINRTNSVLWSQEISVYPHQKLCQFSGADANWPPCFAHLTRRIDGPCMIDHNDSHKVMGFFSSPFYTIMSGRQITMVQTALYKLRFQRTYIYSSVYAHTDKI